MSLCIVPAKFLKILFFSVNIIDEVQMINDQRKAHLLKSMIEIIRNTKLNLKIIVLSALTANSSSLKKFLSAQLLISFQRPVELRKGMVRDGPRANQAINEFHYIEDTFSREKLLTLLEKGITYYNNDLTWEEVVSYEEILDSLWKDEEDAIYTRINYHICKIRKDISKVINNKRKVVKKIENIFKTIPCRGLMLNIKEKELEIN